MAKLIDAGGAQAITNSTETIERFTEPLSGREYAAMQSLFAIISTFEVTEGALEKRLRRLGGGVWRDFRMIRRKADRVMRAMLTTVPVGKLQQVMRNFDYTRVYIRVEAPGIPTKDSTNWVHVPAAALDDLCNTVIGDHCLLCDQSEVEGRKCPLRKSMEAALPHAIKVKRGSDRCMFADLSLGLDELTEVNF